MPGDHIFPPPNNVGWSYSNPEPCVPCRRLSVLLGMMSLEGDSELLFYQTSSCHSLSLSSSQSRRQRFLTSQTKVKR